MPEEAASGHRRRAMEAKRKIDDCSRLFGTEDLFELGERSAGTAIECRTYVVLRQTPEQGSQVVESG